MENIKLIGYIKLIKRDLKNKKIMRKVRKLICFFFIVEKTLCEEDSIKKIMLLMMTTLRLLRSFILDMKNSFIQYPKNT